ncbi:hypothetical protein M9H77_02058 [Catharanthus roseus]|uniref:Uncharacterized protein n=1 Tax=Catharanthus roseus TaxID=4058 RepID=A0ACC0C7R0_CATRO|nr:hypothetical protein M9H77_02058 [Catharanthus roseus]
MHFGVETTNRAESEHSVLKLWLSTCHGDLDTSFGIKKIIDELKKARQLVEEPDSNCLHYLRKSHGLPCACELINRCQHLLPIQEGEVVMFWKKLEISSDIPEEHHRDMESEMRNLTSLQLIKCVIHPVLPDDLSQPLSKPPETAEYVSIAHRKIGKSSDSGSGSGSGSGSRSNPSPRGRGRPPRSCRSRGRGRSNGRLSLSTVVSPDSPPVPFPFKNAFPGFTYQFIQNWKNVAGDGNCGFRVVSNFLFGDENHWIEIRKRMIFDLWHHMAHRVQVCVTDGDEGEVEI